MRQSLIILLLIITGSSAKAQSEDQINIQSTIFRFFEGISAVNNKAIANETTADFTLLEDGKVWNIDSLNTAISPNKQKNLKRVNRLEFLNSEVGARHAWIVYRNTAEIDVNGQHLSLHWLESAMLVREGKNWRIRLLHSTTIR